MITFGMKLRGVRSALGMSQAELHKATGISQTYISLYERDMPPSPEHAEALNRVLVNRAQELKVNVPWLPLMASVELEAA